MLYGSVGLSAALASSGTFPRVFGSGTRLGRHGGLLITAALMVALVTVLSVGALASVGSAVSLAVFLLVAVAAFRLRAELGASPLLTAVAVAVSGVVLVWFVVDLYASDRRSFWAMIVAGRARRRRRRGVDAATPDGRRPIRDRTAYRARMRWESLFADMEAQLAAGRLADVRADVAELARAERASITLAARARASVGRPVRVLVDGADVGRGRADRRGAGVAPAGDVARAARPRPARGGRRPSTGSPRTRRRRPGLVESRLGLGSRAAGARAGPGRGPGRAGGADLIGRIERVGADHLDLADARRSATSAAWAVAFATLRVVQRAEAGQSRRRRRSCCRRSRSGRASARTSAGCTSPARSTRRATAADRRSGWRAARRSARGRRPAGPRC